MKTNKSFKKRLKVSKNGKVSSRKQGQNHFNAKERRGQKSAKGRSSIVPMTNKSRSRFLVGI